jgi:hypothetical protein
MTCDGNSARFSRRASTTAPGARRSAKASRSPTYPSWIEPLGAGGARSPAWHACSSCEAFPPSTQPLPSWLGLPFPLSARLPISPVSPRLFASAEKRLREPPKLLGIPPEALGGGIRASPSRAEALGIKFATLCIELETLAEEFEALCIEFEALGRNSKALSTEFEALGEESETLSTEFEALGRNSKPSLLNSRHSGRNSRPSLPNSRHSGRNSRPSLPNSRHSGRNRRSSLLNSRRSGRNRRPSGLNSRLFRPLQRAYK